MTLEEAFTGKKPNIAHLRVFGCLAYVLKPQELQLKLDPNSYKTAFVGYEESARQYRFYDPARNLIVRSHNVQWYENERLDIDWNEHIDGYLTLQTDDSDDSDSEEDTISPTPPEERTGGLVRALFPPPSMVPRADLQPETDQPNMPNEPETESASVPQAESSDSRQQSDALPEIAVSNRPARTRKPVDRLIETIGLPSARSALERPNIPANYNAAINNPVYSTEWKAAI
jgi:hypothetical protein